MKKLVNTIARSCGTQPDKVKHVAVSALLVLMIYTGLVFLDVDAAMANLLALGITLLIGLAKELTDRFTGGDSDVADMAANMAGALPTPPYLAADSSGTTNVRRKSPWIGNIALSGRCV